MNLRRKLPGQMRLRTSWSSSLSLQSQKRMKKSGLKKKLKKRKRRKRKRQKRRLDQDKLLWITHASLLEIRMCGEEQA